MDIKEAILARHSVRSYIDKPLDDETVSSLKAVIDNVTVKADFIFSL